jgi:type I restriction enzyme S subunit
MQSNYKRIGDYIKEVKEKNVTLEATLLLGININKFFMPSVANVIGTDMSNYRIVKKNQFACNRMHVGRDYRIPVALSNREEPFMVSPAYDVFEIIDTSVLLPEYLMMWFSRKEFDRNAWFYTDADVRGGLHWKAFCDMQLPIPSIEKQREIVKEYNVIQNRILLNNHLISKLEETAQAVYNNWFANDIELGNLPDGWEMGILEDLVEFKNGKSKPKESGLYPVYGGNGIIEFVNEYNNENVIPIGRVGAYCGSLYRELGKCWISDNAIAAKSKINCNMYTYYLLRDLKLNERSEGTGQPLITQGLLNSIAIPRPKSELIFEFEKYANKLFAREDIIEKETKKLEELKDLLLAKMTRVESEKLIKNIKLCQNYT